MADRSKEAHRQHLSQFREPSHEPTNSLACLQQALLRAIAAFIQSGALATIKNKQTLSSPDDNRPERPHAINGIIPGYEIVMAANPHFLSVDSERRFSKNRSFKPFRCRRE